MSEQSGYQVSESGARMYEKYSTLFMRQFVPDLLEVAALQPGERVLDLACGTGVIARHAAARVGAAGQVTGLDINAAMLAVARAMPPESGASIQWVEGSAVSMNFPGASFDVILCQQGLQFFPERSAALREMLRVLVRDGRIALSIWKSASPYNEAVGEALDRFTDAETAKKYRSARAAPNAETLREMVIAAGFRNVEVRPRAVTVHMAEIERFVVGNLAGGPVARAIAALGEKRRSAFARQVRESCSATRRGMTWFIPTRSISRPPSSRGVLLNTACQVFWVPQLTVVPTVKNRLHQGSSITPFVMSIVADANANTAPGMDAPAMTGVALLPMEL